ncbi:PAS domain S-box protein [Longimicrobium sp.]|uniref:PAS domain S-box protein n=1 Tax=Longimicrobium sp. TaxID=2029185 RepID=UPI002BF67C84|nr:PAS domain S-box protein [Longimicrobium sp.]HSU15740.1 PAS domain S-box protein [Longimicrobium sp.]
MRGAGPREPVVFHHLLEQTVEELRVAVEELRVTQEEVAEALETSHAARTPEEAEAARLRDAFTAAPFPLVLTDGMGMLLYANAAAGALLGVRPPDLAGKPLAVFVAEEARKPFRTLLNHLSREAAPRACTLTLQPRARLPLEVEASVWPVPESDGMSFGWRLADVTERRAEEAGLREQTAVLRATMDSLPEAVAAMDLDGTVLVWNRAAAALLGWGEDEVVGRQNPAVGDEVAAVLAAVRSGARSEAAAPSRVAAVAERREGDPLPVELFLAPLVDAGGKARGTVSVIRPAAGGAPPEQRWTEAEMRRVLLEGATVGTLADRLRDGIAAGLHAGYLRAGDRLPSIRDAAQETGIDHRIVAGAYRRLSAAGFVEVRYRKGVRVAAPPSECDPELGETAEWLAGVLEQAAGLQVRVPGLPDLVRRWTAAVPLRCACVDATTDARAALCHEMEHQWGMQPVPVALRPGADGRRELAEALRDADLVVTTHFHGHELAAACQAEGKPLVIARLSPEVVAAVEECVSRRPLTALVADPAFGERLRALAGGAAIQVVPASEHAAVEQLDLDTPVLATLAAREQVSRKLRLLVPATHFVAPVSVRTLARLLVRANMLPRDARN